MDRAQILVCLADPNTPFLDKFRYAFFLEADVWERTDSPNLSENELKKLISHIPGSTKPTWDKRDSNAGPHGLTGDEDVFKFEFSAKFFGMEITYFVKGYFFDKDNCHGVCIQSFREVRRNKITRMKIVR